MGPKGFQMNQQASQAASHLSQSIAAYTAYMEIDLDNEGTIYWR